MLPLFDKKRVIAMIHVPALPGTPKNTLRPDEIVRQALDEAELYASLGIDSVIIENMHDRPFLKHVVGPEVTSLMAVIGYEIKKKTNLYCGVQILAAANREALSVAHAAGLDFIRSEGFVYGHLADEGYIESDAASLLRFRKQIGAENILIFSDIKKKHSSHAITSDLNIEEHALTAEFFLSDGIIITGKSTGLPPDPKEVFLVKRAVNIPVLLGSGITHTNIGMYYKFADAFIIGSQFKLEGQWQNPIDEHQVKSFMQIFNELAGKCSH
jgi:uncharacterized protein